MEQYIINAEMLNGTITVRYRDGFGWAKYNCSTKTITGSVKGACIATLLEILHDLHLWVLRAGLLE